MGTSIPKMYRAEEKLCLKWNDFQEVAISAFGTLRDDREFADVTLACEDGEQLDAHKVILASSSPFFSKLLRKNKHPHPLIYMRGMKSEDLLAMVDFLYFGEANVLQSNLDTFFAVAEELQLMGLVGSGIKKEIEENTKQVTPQKKKHKSKQTKLLAKYFPQHPDCFVGKEEPVPHVEEVIVAPDLTVAADLQDLDDKIKSMMTFSDKYTDGSPGRCRVCTVCGKEGAMANVFNHIEAHHITGVSHTCDECGKLFRTRDSLRGHARKFHKTNDVI